MLHGPRSRCRDVELVTLIHELQSMQRRGVHG
jgi:hypothetical protein